MAWSNFTGGSNAASECIPDIPVGDINFATATNQFYCNSSGYTVDVRYDGGVLPVAWTTTMGQIAKTGNRTATVKIHSAVTSPIIFFGYQGDYRSGVDTPSCNDTLFGYAYVRLGKKLLDKGVFDNCRHHCDYLSYNCFGEVNNGDEICGDNAFVIEPFDCPFSEVTGAGSAYGTAGKCIGPCVDAGSVNFTYSEFAFLQTSLNPECAHGQPDYTTPPEPLYLAAGNPIYDVRHPNLKASGCSPCALVQSMDVIITAVDAAGTVIVQDIAIN